MLGALSVDTGNPADERIKTELLPLCNLEIRLNDRMSQRRVYPALDLSAIQIRGEETQTTAYLRSEYLPKHGAEALLRVVSESCSYEDFEEKIKH